jgi:dynein intermediate chain
LGAKTIVRPIKSFDDFDDYVSDIAWSPTHSSLFVAADVSGNVFLYNLNQAETPIARTESNSRGINKVGWSMNGDWIATACIDGAIEVFDVSKV